MSDNVPNPRNSLTPGDAIFITIAILLFGGLFVWVVHSSAKDYENLHANVAYLRANAIIRDEGWCVTSVHDATRPSISNTTNPGFQAPIKHLAYMLCEDKARLSQPMQMDQSE